MQSIAEVTGDAVHDGVSAASVTVLGASTTPEEGQYAVGFDNGDGLAQNDSGRRVALLTTYRGTTYAFLAISDTLETSEFTVSAGHTPTDALVDTAPEAPAPAPDVTPAPPWDPTPPPTVEPEPSPAPTLEPAPSPAPSLEPAPSPTPTLEPTPLPTPAPTPSPTAAPSPAPAPVCTAVYSTTGPRLFGYKGQIEVRSTKGLLSSWEVRWNLPPGTTITSTSGGVTRTNGSEVTVTNTLLNGLISTVKSAKVTFNMWGPIPDKPFPVSCDTR